MWVYWKWISIHTLNGTLWVHFIWLHFPGQERYIARALTLKIPKMQLQAFVQYDQLWCPRRLTQDLCRSYMMHLKKRTEYILNIITFQKTKEVCMGFATQWHFVATNKSYRESQRRIQCLLLFEQHAGLLSVLDIT
jgi:hypothetical protein